MNNNNNNYLVLSIYLFYYTLNSMSQRNLKYFAIAPLRHPYKNYDFSYFKRLSNNK